MGISFFQVVLDLRNHSYSTDGAVRRGDPTPSYYSIAPDALDDARDEEYEYVYLVFESGGTNGVNLLDENGILTPVNLREDVESGGAIGVNLLNEDGYLIIVKPQDVASGGASGINLHNEDSNRTPVNPRGESGVANCIGYLDEDGNLTLVNPKKDVDSGGANGIQGGYLTLANPREDV